MFKDIGIFLGGILFGLIAEATVKKGYEKASVWNKRRKAEKAEKAFKAGQQKKAEEAAKVINLSDLGLDVKEAVAKAQDNNVVVLTREQFDAFTKSKTPVATEPVEAK